MLPGDPDAAMELDAVLDEICCPLADIRLCCARQFGGVGGAVLHGPGCVGRDAMATLEPHLHIGEPMLEGLIGAEWATESETVCCVLGRHLEDMRNGPV